MSPVVNYLTPADIKAAREVYPHEKIPYPALVDTWVHSGWLIGGHLVTIQAYQLQLSVTAMLGPNGGKETGGDGTWEEVSIPRGDPFTQWKGRSLVTMDLNLIFDGWGVNPRSVEADLSKLQTLGRRIPGTLEPQRLRIWGAIPRWGLAWVLNSIEWGDCIRDPSSGARVRQEVTLKLIEYRAEQAIAQLPRAAASAKPPQKYKVKKGDNLKKIATKLLGKSSKWQQIEKANKGMRGWKLGSKWVGKTIKVPPK